MRGDDRQQGAMYSYISPEARVPQDHPLRAIRGLMDEVLRELSPRFEGLYARVGRPSIPPEQLLRAQLLQVLYTVRSERQLMEQLDYNLLFRWFVGLNMDDRIWDPTVFTKNRQRLLEGDVAMAFLERVVAQAAQRGLLSGEHFTVDGTLIEAWASMKSFRPKDGSGAPPTDGGRNTERDFHGEKRTNETHASTTDPDARLYRKSAGQGAKLCHMGHLTMENRHGLIVETELTPATGWGERVAAEAMIEDVARGPCATLAADKAYDTMAFVAALRAHGVVPHVAQNLSGRRSAIDARTTRHAGYALSQRARKRIEEAFGWIKTIGGLRKTRHRGRDKVRWAFTLTAAAYNLIRLPKLLGAAA